MKDGIRFKFVGRWSKAESLLRICRFMKKHGEGPFVGGDNFDAKLSFAIEIKLADFWIGCFWKKAQNDLWIWICLIPCFPIRVHYQKSYGGWHV